MTLSDYIACITEVARRAKSESKLEGEFNQILKECLYEFGNTIRPSRQRDTKKHGLIASRCGSAGRRIRAHCLRLQSARRAVIREGPSRGARIKLRDT